MFVYLEPNVCVGLCIRIVETCLSWYTTLGAGESRSQMSVFSSVH